MNQTCKVCGEPAAGFHFGAFTCEGCKSFFGRSYNNLSSINECKNNGKCVIDKKNRTTCKACRLRKCYTVGMSKGGSRYGRRSNWFKIHCLLQEQQQQAVEAASKGGSPGCGAPTGFGDMAAAAAAAQQHMQQQQRNSMAMGGLLGYPGYLPAEIMQSTSPFMSAGAAGQRHSADAAAVAAASLPFFSMMNSLPHSMGGSAPSAFQLPPHLLFPRYHPGLAADATYRSEMFKHRQSVDSAASGESQRYSPAERLPFSGGAEEENRLLSSVITTAALQPREMTPELCVSGDDEESSVLSERNTEVVSHHSISPMATSPSSHPIHSPIAIRAIPQAVSPLTSIVASRSSSSSTTLPESTTAAIAGSAFISSEPTASTLSFTAKMQSLSPVSVCSLSTDTVAQFTACSASAIASSIADQDCPMDLSMKTSVSSVTSFNTSSGESDSSAEEELRQAASRRKFYHLSSEQESDDASSASDCSEAVKRQKLAADASTAAANYGGFAQHNSATSLRVFVCV